MIRELRGPWLRPGESRAVPFLPSALRARLQHQKPAWSEAVVRRSGGTELAASVLGKIAAYTYADSSRAGDRSPPGPSRRRRPTASSAGAPATANRGG